MNTNEQEQQREWVAKRTAEKMAEELGRDLTFKECLEIVRESKRQMKKK